MYYQDAGADAAIDGSYTNQAVSWLKQANRVRDLILAGKAEAAARYARRNVLRHAHSYPYPYPYP